MLYNVAMSEFYVLVLAAGKGKRMKSSRAKVLHPLCGVPLIRYVCDTALRLQGRGVFLVIGQDGEMVRAALADKSIAFVVQPEQLGTGHAVMCAADSLAGKEGDLLVLYGDTPLVRPETLERLLEAHRGRAAAATVLTAQLEDPTGYGRIVRSSDGRLERIVEEKDASPSIASIKEINTGIYCFKIAELFPALRQVSNDNAQGEYYLTDVIALLGAAGKRIETVEAADPEEVLGINTRYELAVIEKKMRRAVLRRLMEEGVTVIDPEATYVDADVEIGRDTVVYPNVFIEKGTKIGEGCVIHTGSLISSSVIGDRVTVWPSSVIAESRVGRNSTVGPCAHLRANTVVGEGCRIGNFVEIKNSRLGNGTKAAHLAYIGDAEIGEHVNIGAGTITCNYDGFKKSKTIIEDEAFIGSDSQLVAPVRIGRGAYVAAGSTITMDVPAYALAIARGRQVNKEGWVTEKLEGRKSEVGNRK